MLVDLGDIIVQIFSREGREYYKLVEHWQDLEEARKLNITHEEYLLKIGKHKTADPPPDYS
jgi:hypothetical protein